MSRQSYHAGAIRGEPRDRARESGTRMRAVLCRALGDPTKPRSEGGALGVEDVPSPRCAREGVKVRVEAASLNFADVLMVQGSYQEKPHMPFIPGGECAGVVTECGADVRGLKVGDRVAGVTMGGGAMAEECVIPKRMCFPVPAGVSLAQVQEATGFDLVVDGEPQVTALPTASERAALDRLDPDRVVRASMG